MASYKRINEIETLTETGESASALAEKDSTLKKIPMELFGGKEKGVFIFYSEFSSTGSYSDGEQIEAVANMTFNELYTALSNNTLILAAHVSSLPNNEYFWFQKPIFDIPRINIVDSNTIHLFFDFLDQHAYYEEVVFNSDGNFYFQRIQHIGGGGA